MVQGANGVTQQPADGGVAWSRVMTLSQNFLKGKGKSCNLQYTDRVVPTVFFVFILCESSRP